MWLCGRTPYHPPPPLYTVYVFTVYLFTQGRGGGKLNQREGHRGNSPQSWVKNTNMTDGISSLLNSDKHLPQSPFTGQFALVSI